MPGTRAKNPVDDGVQDYETYQQIHESAARIQHAARQDLDSYSRLRAECSAAYGSFSRGLVIGYRDSGEPIYE